MAGIGIGLSFARGKEVYDKEVQRRAEMETYRQDEAARDARRRLAVAQAADYEDASTFRQMQRAKGIAEASEYIENRDNRRVMAKAEAVKASEFIDDGDLRAVQKETKMLQEKTNNLKAQLAEEELSALVNDERIIKAGYSAIMSGDPGAVTQTLSELGASGFIVNDKDGWQDGELTIQNAQTGESITFNSKDEAALHLYRIPYSRAIQSAMSKESATLAYQKEMREYQKDINIQAMKSDATIKAAQAKAQGTPKQYYEAQETLAALQVGLYQSKDVDGWFKLDPETGESKAATRADLNELADKVLSNMSADMDTSRMDGVFKGAAIDQARLNKQRNLAEASTRRIAGARSRRTQDRSDEAAGLPRAERILARETAQQDRARGVGIPAFESETERTLPKPIRQ